MTGAEQIFLIVVLAVLVILPVAGIYLPRLYLEKLWVRKLYLGNIEDAEKRRQVRETIVTRMPAFVRLYRIWGIVCIVYILGASVTSYSLINRNSVGIWLTALIFIGSILFIVLILVKCSIITGEYIAKRLGETNSNWW